MENYEKILLRCYVRLIQFSSLTDCVDQINNNEEVKLILNKEIMEQYKEICRCFILGVCLRLGYDKFEPSNLMGGIDTDSYFVLKMIETDKESIDLKYLDELIDILNKIRASKSKHLREYFYKLEPDVLDHEVVEPVIIAKDIEKYLNKEFESVILVEV